NAAPAGRVVVRFSANGEGVRADLEPAARAEAVEARKSASLEIGRFQPVKAPPPAPGSAAAGAQARRSIVVPPAPADPAQAMQALLELCQAQSASDLHLTSRFVPALRIDGDVVSVEGWGEPNPERLEKLLWTMAPPANREQWAATKDTDFAYE